MWLRGWPPWPWLWPSTPMSTKFMPRPSSEMTNIARPSTTSGKKSRLTASTTSSTVITHTMLRLASAPSTWSGAVVRVRAGARARARARVRARARARVRVEFRVRVEVRVGAGVGVRVRVRAEHLRTAETEAVPGARISRGEHERDRADQEAGHVREHVRRVSDDRKAVAHQATWLGLGLGLGLGSPAG